MQMNVVINYVPDLPCDFVRKPRSLKFMKRFKATEFRQILLYTSLVVFNENETILYLVSHSQCDKYDSIQRVLWLSKLFRKRKL